MAGLVYSLVSRGATVFCEHCESTGNFQQVTRVILEKFDASSDGPHSYAYDEATTFHLLVEGGIVYLAMTDAMCPRATAMKFLQDVREKFSTKYHEIAATAVAYEMNKTFSPVLAARMAHYNANPEADSKVKKVRGEIEEVRQVMVENIEAILERGDKIELLVDKSGDLSEQASKFKKSSIQLKRNMWWQQCRLQAIIFGSVTGLTLIIVMAATKCFGHC